MQVNVIRGGEAAANALIYPPPDNNLLTYLNNNIQSAIESTANLSNHFVQSVKGMYEKFNNSAVLNAGRALLYSTGTHFNQNVIFPLNNGNMVTANLIMQQYIMAHPEVNHLNHQNMCYGFQDTYFNYEPEVYGKDRMDYQRVMDGVLQINEEGEDGYIMYYSNGDIQDELHPMDKLSILDTWSELEYMIANGDDPTDPDGGSL